MYVGDTARVPYGPKSPVTVQRYALQIGEWLVEQGVKCVVVACNTATAHALPLLQTALPVPVVGVVEPGARAAARTATRGPVGVIGTAGTVASGVYERAIHALRPELSVISRPTPLLVPLVEEGWLEHAATRLVVREYLAPLKRAQVEALVLGCTHYPLLAPVVRAVMGDDVQLIDSAEETAADVAATLADHALLSSPSRGAQPRHRFIASDAPQHFLTLGQRFLGGALADVEHHVFT